VAEAKQETEIKSYNSSMELFLVAGILVVVLALGFIGVMSVSVRRDIEDALKNASKEEEEELRKKVVQTFYPPRFRKD